MDDRLGEAHELEDREANAHSSLLDQLESQDHANGGPASAPVIGSQERSTAFLDGLRGLAAFFVFIQHFVGGFDFNVHEYGFGQDGKYFYFASLPFVRVVFSGGSAAVAIFFVLSGYVLSKSPLTLLRNGNRQACGRSLLSATIRRPIRLYLPPLAVTFLVALLMHAPFNIMPKQLWPEPKPTVFAEIWNWVVTSIQFFNPFRTHGSNQGWFPYSLVVWTIPIELKGSILIYFLTAIHNFTAITLPLLLFSLTAITLFLLQVGAWTMACFIAGLILSYFDVYSIDATHFYRRFTLRTQSLISHFLFVLGWYLLSQPSHSGHPEYSLNTPGYHTLTLLTPAVYDESQYYRFWHSYGAWLMVYSTLRLPWLQRFLSTRPLLYLGKVSFLLYLVHLPLLNIVGDRIHRMLGHISTSDDDKSFFDNLLPIPDVGPAALSSRFLICVALTLPVVLVVSDVGTRVLDVPSVRVGKKLVKRLGLDVGGEGRKGTGSTGRSSMMAGEQVS